MNPAGCNLGFTSSRSRYILMQPQMVCLKVSEQPMRSSAILCERVVVIWSASFPDEL